MALLALPAAGSAGTSPRKEKKRKRKDKAKDKKDKKEDKNEYDSDAELEISAEDLVAADGAEGGGPRTQGEGDDDDEEEAPATGQVTVDVKQKAKRRRDETLLLRGVLDEEQGRRFDAFRSTVINKAVVKKLNRDLYDQHIPSNLTAVVAGMVKIFVADVVETARDIQSQSEHPEGPLQPYHLQMARVHLQQQGLVGAPTGTGGTEHSSTGLRPRKRMFRR